VPAEERELLRTVGRVVGWTEIDRDPAGAPLQPLAMAVDQGGGQVAPHPPERRPAHAILEARRARLRRQRRRGDRVAVQEQLVDRIVREAISVVRVGMAPREPEDALREEVAQGVSHLPPSALVDQAARQVTKDPVPRLRRLQQNRAAVGARVGLIRRRNNRLVEQLRKQYSPCGGIVRHDHASGSRNSLVTTSFLRHRGVRASARIDRFAN